MVINIKTPFVQAQNEREGDLLNIYFELSQSDKVSLETCLAIFIHDNFLAYVIKKMTNLDRKYTLEM